MMNGKGVEFLKSEELIGENKEEVKKFQDECLKFSQSTWGDLDGFCINLDDKEISHPYAGREEVSFEKGSTDA
ncbi:hypothetical protein Tco_1006210 [Tanacetum coccineum]|uniref:Uncharacterized protein n=1 Tax=Tanacetum coccineum TaxID=301880 RepID=A0ABQ5FJF1_9ASTR